ncbi:MAG TPA: TspO/MBR family protein [Rubrobacter sp.]|nr:TspO/MBR family protein [Rubrobacter sp.]
MATGWTPLALAVGLCAAVAVLEGFLTGSGLKDWYPRLRKPRWQIPLWAFVAVGLIVYVIDGFVAYRLLTAVPSAGDRAVALTALVVVMVLNALWSYAFFEYRSTLVGFFGIVGFLGPLLVLQTALFVYDPVAAWAHMAYTLYVLAYDVPLFYEIWRLNPDH